MSASVLRAGRAGVLLLGVALGGPAGCQNAPAGDPGARVDPYRRTDVDFSAPEADSASLLEFGDQVSQKLAMRISDIEQIRSGTSKAVIELGGIENRTKTPSSDFEIIRRRVFAGLVNSPTVRRYADIVEVPEAMDIQHDRLAGRDASGSPAGSGADRYGRDTVYVLQGYFGEITRAGGAQSNFYLEMSLTHLSTRRMLFVEQYDMKQLR